MDIQAVKRIEDALTRGREIAEAFATDSEANQEYQIKTAACFTLRHTDMGNAERLLIRHQDDLRYVREAKAWAHYNGRRWDMSGGDLAAVSLAQDVIRKIYYEAKFAGSDKEGAAQITAHADRSSSARNTRGLLEQAKSLFSCSILDFDTDDTAHLFNCGNGTVDLRTGSLYAHSSDHMLTALCHIDYKPGAKADRWGQFIQEVCVDENLQRDPEKEEFIHRALGYSMIGTNEEQVAFFIPGRSNDRKKNGENGKGVLQNTVKSILGDYFASIDRRLVCRDSRGEVDPKMNAALIGKRVAFGSELLKTDVLHPQNFKNLCGEDVVKAKLLYKDEVDLENKAAIWYLSNYLPIVPDDDEGIQRRIVIIPFLNKFYRAEDCPEGGFVRDNNLKGKLAAEREGILAWFVRGAVEFFRRGGIHVPAHLKMIKEARRADFDQLHEWEKRCITFDPEAIVPAMDLIQSVKNFNRLNGEGDLSDTLIGRKMTERGIEKIDRDPITGKTFRRTMRQGVRLTDIGRAYMQNEVPEDQAAARADGPITYTLGGGERISVRKKAELPTSVLQMLTRLCDDAMPQTGVHYPLENGRVFVRTA